MLRTAVRRRSCTMSDEIPACRHAASRPWGSRQTHYPRAEVDFTESIRLAEIPLKRWAVAQLGERVNRIQEVARSTRVSSTNKRKFFRFTDIADDANRRFAAVFQLTIRPIYILLLSSCLTLVAATSAMMPTSLALPGGEGGVGFDDMGFARSLRRVLVPGGRSGNLDLIDPDTLEITLMGGFSRRSAFAGGHGHGVTSADEGRGLIFAIDRDARRLDVIDPKSPSIIVAAQLASGPDYVRFVSTTDEVWVTEPGAERIEIFSLPDEKVPKPVHAGFISVAGGPESLVIDDKRGRAYTNLWTDKTVVINLKTRKIDERWKNGCKESRGLAIDDARGFLFVGCEEGKLSVLNLATGARLGSASSGDGVDIIAYNSQLRHIYLPGARSGTMAIIGISSKGGARVLETVKTARGAHCAAADNRDNVYVCDPTAGRLLVFKDQLPVAR
jgi:hypothetical protein